MFLNHLKITLRAQRKNRMFSLINSTGLALGIAAFVLILEYMAYERSVNGFPQNLPMLYRVLAQNREGDIVSDMAPAVGPLAKQEFPEVNDFYRVGEHSANGIISVANGSNGQAAQSFREDRAEGILLSISSYRGGHWFVIFVFCLYESKIFTQRI